MKSSAARSTPAANVAVYVELAARVDTSDLDATLARWQFGHHLVAERVEHGGKQLPHGRLDQIASATGKSRREIQRWMQFFEAYDSEAKVRHAWRTFGSWHDIANDGLPDDTPEPSPPASSKPSTTLPRPAWLIDPPGVRYRRWSMRGVEAIEPNGLTAVSSFSGCGGGSLGLRIAGWRVPYAVEFIPAAADCYRANAPLSFVDQRDIREIQPEEILDRLGLTSGALDLFESSFPCASFSPAGVREKGIGQVRPYSEKKQRTDDLWREAVRLIEGLRPRAMLAENVPAFATSVQAAEMIEMLAEIGYRVVATTLNAADYGAPTARKRLIIIGYRDDLGIEPSFPEPTTPGGPLTLRHALEAVPADDPQHAPFITESSMEGLAVGREWRTLKPGTASERYFQLMRPSLDAPCPTITATAKQRGSGSVTHPSECRKLTPGELLSVAGFPGDFALTGDREQRCERVGRAVCPPLYHAIGVHLATLLLGAA